MKSPSTRSFRRPLSDENVGSYPALARHDESPRSDGPDFPRELDAHAKVFVDLDGTLIRTDVFLEATLQFIKQRPLNVFLVFAWLVRGRSVAKALVARHVKADPARLPYELELLDYLKKRREQRDDIVLATASHLSYARTVARHLGIFSGILGSTVKVNMKGKVKLERIRAEAGGGDFCYAGNSNADRVIWRAAEACILVNAPARAEAALRREGKTITLAIKSRAVGLLRAFMLEMRVYQWAKNTLVFVPLLTSHHYLEAAGVVNAIIAFLTFSLCASGAYFFNDLLDLDGDRQHRSKRFRPLASGTLPIPCGVLGAIGLPVCGVGLAAIALPSVFLLVLAVYYLLTTAYSLYLKTVSTVDIMTLALLYTTRVVAGALAIGVPTSPWLLGFSIFLFASLAYLKRYIETAPLETEHVTGRSYSGHDSETMFALGSANATGAIMMLALYISNSDEVLSTYASPQFLWLLCFLLLYWTNRIWVGARRGKIHDDPIVFAIKDRVSVAVAVCVLCVVLLAKYVAT